MARLLRTVIPSVRGPGLIMLSLLTAVVLGGCAVIGAESQSAENTSKYSRLGYEALYSHGTLHEIEIIISPDEWEGLLLDMRVYAATDPNGRPNTGNYRRATFVYRGPAGDAIIEEVGFRVKGHYSRPYPEDASGGFHRAHFKVKLNKVFDQVEGTAEYEERNQRRFAKQRELELRAARWDTTQIRELYAYDLMRRAGVNTSRTGSTRLTITVGDEKHDFGIYTLVEVIDKSFLTKRYGSGANDGNLYKCLWGDSGPANLGPIDDPNNFQHPFAGNKQIIGVKDWRAHYRPTYDLKRNTEVPDHGELLDFIDNLNTLSGPPLKAYLEANFEVDRFLRYLAMNFLVGNGDDYWAVGNNYYLYFNNDGKIEFFPVDYDMSFGDGWGMSVPYFDTAHVGIYDWGNRNRELLELIGLRRPEGMPDEWASWDYPLVEKMFEIQEYRQRYESYLREFITPANGLFLYSEFEREFDLMYPVYLPHVDNETGEDTEMHINDRVRRYYYEKTLSIISQLGLDEADYEIPPFKSPAPTVTSTSGGTYNYVHPSELSFADDAVEEISETWSASFRYPDTFSGDLSNIAYTASYGFGLTFMVYPAADFDTFEAALQGDGKLSGLEILNLYETALADGTPASLAEFNASTDGYGFHVFSIGVIHGNNWVVVHVRNWWGGGAYDEAFMAEIVHTLTLQ